MEDPLSIFVPANRKKLLVTAGVFGAKSLSSSPCCALFLISAICPRNETLVHLVFMDRCGEHALKCALRISRCAASRDRGYHHNTAGIAEKSQRVAQAHWAHAEILFVGDEQPLGDQLRLSGRCGEVPLCIATTCGLRPRRCQSPGNSALAASVGVSCRCRFAKRFALAH